ncbi:MAG: hypothetical protein ABEH66_05795 [Halobacteriales archaeon]
MVTTIGVVYVLFGFLLFFFWVYGIASFVHDAKRRYIPAIREYKREEEGEEPSTPEEKMNELYGDPEE